MTRPNRVTQTGEGVTIIPVSRFDASTAVQISVSGTATWELKWTLGSGVAGSAPVWADHPDGALTGTGEATARFRFPMQALRLEVISGEGSVTALIVAAKSARRERGVAAGGGGGGGAFDPATGIFTGAVYGAWYEPADLDTLYNDLAGTTTPASVDGRVGHMKDKSGNGLDLAQSTNPAFGPLLRVADGKTYLEFSGGQQISRTGVQFADGPINIAVALVKKATDTNARTIWAINDTNNPSGRLRVTGSTLALTHRGGAIQTVTASGSYPTPGSSLVIFSRMVADVAPHTIIRADGVEVANSNADPNLSGDTYGTRLFRLGAETDFPGAPFWGDFYGLIWWVGDATIEQIEGVEAYLAALT